MAGAHAQLVRDIMDAFNRGDFEAGLAHMEPDAVWDWSNSIGPYAGVIEGVDGLRAMLADFIDTFQGVTWNVADMIEVDDARVIVATHVVSKGRSGLETEARGAQLWTVVGGKVTRAKLYQSVEDALADV